MGAQHIFVSSPRARQALLVPPPSGQNCAGSNALNIGGINLNEPQGPLVCLPNDLIQVGHTVADEHRYLTAQKSIEQAC
jgi:hypothetical protein